MTTKPSYHTYKNFWNYGFYPHRLESFFIDRSTFLLENHEDLYNKEKHLYNQNLTKSDIILQIIIYKVWQSFDNMLLNFKNKNYSKAIPIYINSKEREQNIEDLKRKIEKIVN